jgi:hypothetical protein
MVGIIAAEKMSDCKNPMTYHEIQVSKAWREIIYNKIAARIACGCWG